MCKSRRVTIPTQKQNINMHLHLCQELLTCKGIHVDVLEISIKELGYKRALSLLLRNLAINLKNNIHKRMHTQCGGRGAVNIMSMNVVLLD